LTIAASRWVGGIVVLWVSCGVIPLTAQQSDTTDAMPRTHIGAVSFSPSIELNGGVDTNVFNSPVEQRPDFNWILTPKTSADFRMGRALVSGGASADFVYFKTYATERSINLDGSMKVTVPLNRVRPYFSASFLKTRQRPSVEIDSRSMRHEHSFVAGATVRFSGRSEADVSVTSSDVAFDPSAVYLDTYLRDVFNRTTTTVKVSGRYVLTPLTAVSLAVDSTEEHFTLSPVRDSRSVRIAPTVTFASTALISGSASIGYRAFNALDPSLTDFKGAVGSVDLAYTLSGSTRFTVQASRDIEYSYEVVEPYYLITGFGGGVTQRISNSIGVTARAARYQLVFQTIASAPAGSYGSEPDLLNVDGVGVFYKVGRKMRVNVYADYYNRASSMALRSFHGIRAGSSVVCGF
jgi:hypothetical protein